MHSNTIFVGGGSLGHVAPSVSVWEAMRTLQPDARAHFICAPREEEVALLKKQGLPYTTLCAGKFPRGLSIRWITFPPLFLWSLLHSIFILLNKKPAVIFSKGGYVSVPVCLVAHWFGIPIVLHESDSAIGKANRMIAKMARKVCVGFPSANGNSKFQIPNSKELIFTGNPTRPDILNGSKHSALQLTGFSGTRPVLLVIGGSQGSVALNDAVRASIDTLLQTVDIVHLTGKGKAGVPARTGYWSRPYVFDELKDLYALADIVVTRAGAGTLSELAAVQKPAIVVPLRGVAEDHQWKNAQVLAQKNAVIIVEQERLDQLPTVILELVQHREKQQSLSTQLHSFFPPNAAQAIARQLTDA